MAFRRTVIALSEKSRSKSASWASRQYRDPYVKKRLSDPAAYRARSAFKLLEINERWKLFDYPDVNAVVDLGAAPGGWSQFVAAELGWTVPCEEESNESPEPVSESPNDIENQEAPLTQRKPKKPVGGRPQPARLEHFDPLNIDDGIHSNEARGHGKIIAVDLLDIAPIHGVYTMKANFLEPSTTRKIKEMLIGPGNRFGKADVILSDMAANVTGNDHADIQSSYDICEAVFEFASYNLRTARSVGRRQAGVLLIKYFNHPMLEDFLNQHLKPNFNSSYIIKPKSSRASSRESYFLCRGWNPRYR